MERIKSISTAKMSREEWIAARRAGIGGSDAGAICGLNPYRSPVDVWLDKTGRSQEKPDREAMRIGRDLEQYVADRFAEKTGLKVRKDNRILTSTDFPFMLANIDRRIVGENAILECKTASPYNRGLWQDGKCPESYEVQCHHYMAVTGAAKVYLAALILGVDFVVVEINRDEDVIRDLRNIEGEFWNKYVITGEMPAPDGSGAATEAIRELFPTASEKTVDLSHMSDLIERYDEIHMLEDELEEEKDSIKQQLQIAMQDADTAYIGDRKITWKNTNPRTVVDSKRLRAEAPETFEKFTRKVGGGRTFRIW